MITVSGNYSKKVKSSETEDDLDIEEAKCSKCGAEMEMEELEDEFFAFASHNKYINYSF